MFVCRKACQNVFATLKRHSWEHIGLKALNGMPISMEAARRDPVVMTVTTPEFKSVLTPEVDTLVNLFRKYNYEIRIAGGAVRDILMGIVPADLDFASNATPDQMVKMFTEENIRMINTNGIKHGTVTPRINDKANFEVTTLRIDVATDGRRALVEFTNDWRQDAGRRDLTINSMFLDLNGKLYDYFYGYNDLLKRRVVFVGDPEKRITEDYLRILRYFRFYGRIAEQPDTHDETTIKAIKNTVDGLAGISGERIWSELSKILTGRFNAELTVKMFECGLGKHMGFPEEVNLKHFQEVCRRCTENNVTMEPIAYAAALLRDINDLDQLHRRLKLSRFSFDTAQLILEYRRENFDRASLSHYLPMFVTMNGNQANNKKSIENLLRYHGYIQLADEFANFTIPRFPVSGQQLEPFAKTKKQLAPIIRELKIIWAKSLCTMTGEELVKEVPQIVEDLKEPGIQRKKNIIQ